MIKSQSQGILLPGKGVGKAVVFIKDLDKMVAIVSYENLSFRIKTDTTRTGKLSLRLSSATKLENEGFLANAELMARLAPVFLTNRWLIVTKLWLADSFTVFSFAECTKLLFTFDAVCHCLLCAISLATILAYFISIFYLLADACNFGLVSLMEVLREIRHSIL